MNTIALFVLIALAAAKPADSDTSTLAECNWKAKNASERCASGFICDDREDDGDGLCHPALALGAECSSDVDLCETTSFCKYSLVKNDDKGVCAAKVKLGAVCAGEFGVACASGLGCLVTAEAKNAEGTCVTVPRQLEQGCNYDAKCTDDNYCLYGAKSNHGVCKKRSVESEPCGAVSSNSRPRCAKGLGCYLANIKGLGVCAKSSGAVGEKCSPPGGLSCDYKNHTFCRLDSGKDLGVCADYRKPGESCPSNWHTREPCMPGYGCYYEKDTDAGVCMKSKNPVGSKCRTWDVGCDDTSYCKTADFSIGVGTCVPKLEDGAACFTGEQCKGESICTSHSKVAGVCQKRPEPSPSDE